MEKVPRFKRNFYSRPGGSSGIRNRSKSLTKSMFRLFRLSWLLLLFGVLPTVGWSEVIYDNTQTVLEAGPQETVEYGDQIDLEGTARTLTALTFFYYGDFEPDAH